MSCNAIEVITIEVRLEAKLNNNVTQEKKWKLPENWLQSYMFSSFNN